VQVTRGLLLVQNVLAAVLAVLRRNQPATKLGDERVRASMNCFLYFLSSVLYCQMFYPIRSRLSADRRTAWARLPQCRQHTGC
jgi:hypothetical protein